MKGDNCNSIINKLFKKFIDFREGWGRERKRDRERETSIFVVPHTYAFIGWFLYVS